MRDIMTQRNGTDDLFARKQAARLALASEAYDLICDIAEIEGGLSEVECTPERAEIWEFVSQHPRYNRAARDRVFKETR
jgi:hypothetical protein